MLYDDELADLADDNSITCARCGVRIPWDGPSWCDSCIEDEDEEIAERAVMEAKTNEIDYGEIERNKEQAA